MNSASVQSHLSTTADAALSMVDAELWHAIAAEGRRQNGQIELIVSENIVSRAVREAKASVLTNKYAEGYLCVAGVLFLVFAGSGEGALLGAVVFFAFGVMMVRICIGLGLKPEKPIDPDERRRRGVHTGSGHLESHHATLQIIIAPATLTVAITLIAVVTS